MTAAITSVPWRTGWVCRTCASTKPLLSSKSRSLHTASQIKSKLPAEPARTRFAPSPTGYLHLGSLRTALFNYLLARRTGGQFLLRIEDTDQKRTVPDAEDRLCQDLRWAGLEWDEGPQVGGPHGPYRQSERTLLYQEHAHILVKSGHAYRCFCKPERLNALARQRSALGLPTDYDRTCDGLSNGESEERAANGESHVVRLKVPPQYPVFQDLVYGKVGKTRPVGVMFKHGEVAYEDPILLKSDGLPTYHLANVVDDHHMKITHVIRAAEWISSTPKHLMLYKAFGWQAPQFAHVGLLQDHNRQKLSKRNGDIDILSFQKESGIFPEALINFVALLGWSHEQKKDFMTPEQLVQLFDLKFTRGNTIVSFEKLWFLQKAHAQHFTHEGGKRFDDIVDQVYQTVQDKLPIDQLERVLRGRDLRSYLSTLLRLDAKGFTTPLDFLQRNVSLLTPDLHLEPYSSTLHSKIDGRPVHDIPIANLVRAATQVARLLEDEWTVAGIKTRLSDNSEAPVHEKTGEQNLVKSDKSAIESQTRAKTKETVLRGRMWNKAFHHYLRWALVEGKQGPSIADTMVLLGRDIVLERLNDAARLATGARGKDDGSGEGQAGKVGAVV